MQHSENRLWKLLALKLSGDATADNLKELGDYLDSHPEEKAVADIINIYWQQANPPITVPQEIEEERFHFIVNAESENKNVESENNLNAIEAGHVLKFEKRRSFKWIYAAASLIIMIGVIFLFQMNSGTEKKSYPKNNRRVVFVKPGSKSSIILPDGTSVTLNGSSKLSYNTDFNEKVREVNLEGEAYFDVTKDTKHPFIVHTSSIDIEVLGTLFNVKSYLQDSTIEATLLRGSIEVYNKEDPSAPKVILKPNEKLVFRKKEDSKVAASKKDASESGKKVTNDDDISVSTLLANQPDSLKPEISWLYNKLIFNGDNFSTIAVKMERWYGVKIEILDTSLDKYHFTGVFEKETLKQALDALRLTAKFRYKIKDNVIQVME